MDESRMQWEKEIYPEISFEQYNSDSKMFTFEAKSIVVEQELDQEEKKGTEAKIESSLTTMALLSFDDQKEANEFKNAIEDRKKQFVLRPQPPGSPLLTVPNEKIEKKIKKAKKGKKGLTKADISGPSNFVRLSK